MSTLKVDTIQDTNAVEMYLCKAWVNYDCTTASIKADGGVSSITDNGTGNFTVTFTNSFSDANYAVGSWCNYSSTSLAGNVTGNSTSTKTASAFQTYTTNSSATSAADVSDVGLIFFR